MCTVASKRLFETKGIAAQNRGKASIPRALCADQRLVPHRKDFGVRFAAVLLYTVRR